MNEIIKELANQCGFRSNPDIYDRNQSFDIPKFAELIVQECIGIVKQRWINPDEDVIAEEIKQHFGVEELKKVAPKSRCSVCGTTENVKYMGGYQPYLCDSEDCIPF